ncbi:MAG: ROK family protein [Thermoplasmata archaeon]|nr:ROK family protein [Thermoplasmata archaeon]
MLDIIASVDIGATKITASLCNRDGIIIRIYQRTRLTGDEGSIPDQVKELVDTCFVKARLEKDKLIAVGISTAGPFQRMDGKLHLVSPNICGGMTPERGVLPNSWRSVPIEKELSKHFKNLVIQNDAVSGVMAERTFGAGKGYENLLYVTWSTGIGTGAFVDGKLIRGKNGNAPHGGHVFLGDTGPVCGCGNTCDLEAVASGTAIALQYGGGATTAEVFEAYSRGDAKAKKVIQEAATYFARGLASINSVLDTKMIVIGGSVFLNNRDLLLPLVKEEFYRSFPALSRDVLFATSELGEYLGDIAAISLVIPEDWIKEWRTTKPWERAPDTIYLDG